GDDGEGATEGEAKEQWDSQIEGRGGNHAGELDERGDEELAVVVVVDVATCEEGIVGRQVAAAQDGGGVSGLHRPPAAHVDVPEVWVEGAYPGERKEGGQKKQLASDEQPPADANKGPERVAAPPGERGAGQRQQREDGDYGPAVERQEAQARGQPDKPGEQQ